MSDAGTNTFEPDYAVPPGETLQEKLDEMGMSQVELSLRIGLSTKQINVIIKGDAPITPETAIGLERTTGITARFWNNREALYRGTLARLKDQEQLQSELSVLDKVPIKDLVKRGYLAKTADKTEMLQQVLSFYGTKGVAELKALWDKRKAAARKSRGFAETPGYTAAWLRMGEIEAMKIACAEYDKEKFHKAIIEIRSLTKQKPEQFVPQMRKKCAAAGVAFIMVPEIEHVPWFGASWWMPNDRGVILLNLRGKKEDHFWFSFFHEAGHILQSQKSQIFIDDQTDDDELEIRANRFAQNTLIPLERKRDLLGLMTYAQVQRFAEEINLSPGVVVGQFQHATQKYRFFNPLKRTFKWGKDIVPSLSD